MAKTFDLKNSQGHLFLKGCAAFLTGLLVLALPASRAPAAEHQPWHEAPVRSGAEIDYPPFSIVDAEGHATGFAVELLRAATKAMGREVTFRTGPWPEVRSWLERGEIDALPLVGRTPERERLFDFTVPYMSLHGAIVVRKGTTDIRDLNDLKGRQVAVMQGDNAEEFLRRENRGVHIVTTATFDAALQELAEGRHDAVVVQRLVALRLIKKIGLANLTVVNKPIEGFRQDFCFAVREGDRETLALLNEGLAIVMADGTYRHLHAKWFAALQLPTTRRIVIGGDSNFPPFEYLDEKGRPAGLNVELTRAIAKEVGLDVEIRLGPWPKVMADLEEGEIDALQGMFYSTARDLRFDFSQPHMVVNYVSVVRRAHGRPPENEEDLAAHRVAVQQGDIAHDYLMKKGAVRQLTALETQEAALRSVVAGKSEVALVARLTAFYFIEKNGWDDLAVGSTALLAPEYCYAARLNQRALLAQLSEGLKALEAGGEYHRIRDKWLGVYADEPPTIVEALRTLMLILMAFLAVFAVVVLWSWSLRRQVARKTRDLQESIDKFKFVFEAANVGKSLTLPTGEINANQAFADLLGYTREEMQGKSWQDLTPAEDIEDAQRRIDPLLKGEADAMRFEKRYVRKDGGIVWADVSASIRRDRQGRPIHFVTNVVDITERKQAQERLLHLTMVLRALRKINQVITQVKDRDQLLHRACSILTDMRGYNSAWICLRSATGEITAAAESGVGEVFASLRKDLARGKLPDCCRLVQDHADVAVIPRTDVNCTTCPLACLHDDAAALAAPLRHGMHDYGVIVVSLPVAVVGDREEQALFKEIANDIAFALQNIEIVRAREKMRAALAASEKQYRLLADNTLDVIWTMDADLVFTYVNPAIEQLTGYAPDEWIGSHLYDHCNETRFEEMAAIIQAELAKGPAHQGVVFETEFLRKDGSPLPVEIHGKVVYGDDGALAMLQGITRDISERRNAEAALQQSEHRLRTLVNTIPDLVWLKDVNGVYLSCNSTFERFFGAKESDIVGRTDYDFVDQDLADFFREHDRKAMAAGRPSINEEALTFAEDGYRGLFETVKAPMFGVDGELIGVLGIARDISERKQAEKELHETAGILKTAMDCSTAGIAIADAPDGKLRYVNEAGLAIGGGSRKELVENVGIEQYAESWQILDFDGRPLTEDEIPLARAVRYGETCDRHFIIRRPDQDRVIWANAAPVLNAKGEVKAGIVVFSDITELRKAERALLESEKKFERLVESSPDAIFVMQEGCFAYLNHATRNLFGAGSRGELRGKPVLERLHLEFRAIFREQIRRLDGKKDAIVLPSGTCLRMDGSAVPVEATAVPIQYENRAAILVFMWDVSERLEKEKAYNNLQEQLAQAQKLESVGRLAGGVAHDFNNILSVIIGYAELAMDDLSPDEPLYGDLGEIVNAATRSRNITRQLLAFARKETIVPEVLDLNETVENLLKMLRRLIGEDIELVWRPGPGLWPVRMDPSQVDQILANLCVNARDAIQDVGKVIIEAKNTSIDAAYCKDHPAFKPGDFVMLAVSDDGCGMDRETVDKIFEPFFTTKGMGQGTGLGLATIYGIVKQNEGFINVYSEPGEGTLFRIYLPRHAGDQEEERRHPVEEVLAGEGETLLVVEDDPAILKLAARILASLNYTVLEAHRPAEAVELAKRHDGGIHLLVTDVVMPDMNGRELSETLAKLHPGMKTLFMSGYTADVIAHRGVLDADVHFLHKPFSKQQLTAKVREALDDRR